MHVIRFIEKKCNSMKRKEYFSRSGSGYQVLCTDTKTLILQQKRD